METITNNPYFSKILLTIIAVVFKLLLDSIYKDEKDLKGLLKLFSFGIYYILPFIVIIWLNLDNKIQNSKLYTSLIAFNIGIIIFNYFQTNITTQYKMITKNMKRENETIKEINQINTVQAEKMKAINENQKYILNELSSINDRIIKYFSDK
jgi:hypothetical protein